MKFVAKAAKAVFAAAGASLSVLGGYLVNDTSLSAVTAGQWVFVIVAGLAAGGAVYRVPNASSQ